MSRSEKESVRFSSERRAARGKMLTVRLTEEQDRLLNVLAGSLEDKPSRADIVRAALDFWVQEGPHARTIARLLEKD